MTKIQALRNRRYGSLGSPRGRGSLGASEAPGTNEDAMRADPWGNTVSTVKDGWELYNPLSLITAGANAITTAVQTVASSSEASANTFASGNSISMADFKSIGGVCKPMNFPALRYVQEMQRQMNRVAEKKSLGKVGIDGAVGPGTLALLKKIQTASAGEVMGNTSACIYIAGDADVIGDQVKTYADSIGAPATTTAPPSSPQVVTATGQVLAAPPSAGAAAGITGAFSGMDTTQKVLLVGMTGGIVYLIHKKMKKKRRG